MHNTSKVYQLTIIIITICITTALAQESVQSLQNKLLQQKKILLQTCKTEKYKFTPKLQQIYINYAKTEAKLQLTQQNKNIPKQFLQQLDTDPLIQATVYGTHLKPADIIQNLYSLQIDLGEKRFNKYIQLMLAQAIVDAKHGTTNPINPRPPLKLNIAAITKDPRIPINTKDSKRKLDMNDHIINFLNENTITETITIGHKPPPLKYDQNGIAIPLSKKEKRKKIPITKTQTRTLYAADVIAHQNLQKKFNAYMKQKGYNIHIYCGEHIVHWNRREAIKSGFAVKIKEAFDLFHNAYKAKGLMPKQRDPKPNSSEKCLYIIQNYQYKFPNNLQKQRHWPRYPLTAPWQTLLMLVENEQPLRERQERWEAFRDKGIFKTYGEYIGDIAQQYDMQSARRIKPYPFTYHTIQMMLKDGGVCGTMGNISARSHITLGIPSCTAGQPRHCAVVAFRYNPKNHTYQCKGSQYATGGDEKTIPHVGWYFGKFKTHINKRTKQTVHDRKPMIYQQSIAWAINYNLTTYTKTLTAETISRILQQEKVPNTNITHLLINALSQNPYNITLIDAIQNLTTTPQQQIKYNNIIQKLITTHPPKIGCPTQGLYNTTITNNMLKKLQQLPIPNNKQQTAEIYQYLQQTTPQIPKTTVRYYLALHDQQQLLQNTQKQFQQHLKIIQQSTGKENDTKCEQMTQLITATIHTIKKRKKRKEWAKKILHLTTNNEKYFGKRYKIKTNPAIEKLAKLARQKLPEEKQQITALCQQIQQQLTSAINNNKRTPKSCRILAKKISTITKILHNKTQQKQWLQKLAQIIKNHEKYKYTYTLLNNKHKIRYIKDPVAKTIQELLKQ